MDAEVLYWRGLAKSRLGQHASAVDDLDAAASKMTSVDVADAVAVARCRAGVASLASGDILHARRHFSVVASQKYAHHKEHSTRIQRHVGSLGNLTRPPASSLVDYSMVAGEDDERGGRVGGAGRRAPRLGAGPAENYELASIDDADALHNQGTPPPRRTSGKERAAFKQVILEGRTAKRRSGREMVGR